MLKSKKFWCYEISENFDLTEEMFQNYKRKGKFYEDGLYFYEQIIYVEKNELEFYKYIIKYKKICIAHLKPN